MSGPSDDLTRINSDNAESQAVFEAAAEYASQNDKLLTKISQDAGVDPGDARDVIHGVLLEVIQNPDTFRKARNLGTFLRKRVQWRARDHRKAKSKHREVPLHDSYDVEDHRAAPGSFEISPTCVTVEAQLEALRLCLIELKDDEQLLLKLKYIDSLTWQEIASQLRSSAKGLAKKTQRILDRIRARMSYHLFVN